jgi:hypothetical protein
MGLCASYSLTKNQATHYYFAAAPFLVVFAVSAALSFAAEHFRSSSLSRSFFLGTSAALAIAVIGIGTVLLVRPTAALRFAQIRDFSDEAAVAETVHQYVPEGKRLLVFGPGDTLWYWLSGRYPPPPFISNDEKTMVIFRNTPDVVLGVLNDPDLRMVKFDPATPYMIDISQTWGTTEYDRSLWSRYAMSVRERFNSLDSAPPDFPDLWVLPKEH